MCWCVSRCGFLFFPSRKIFLHVLEWHILYGLALYVNMGLPGGSDGSESACNVGDLGLIHGWGRFSWRRAWQPTPVFLAGESPWTEEPDRLQSIGSQRVRHDWSDSAQHTHIYKIRLPRWHRDKELACQCRRHGFHLWVRKIPWRRKGQPTPVFLPENIL